MAVALVSHIGATSPNGNGFTTSTITTTGASLLVCVIADSDGSSPPSDSKSNTWATAVGPTATGNPDVTMYYVKNPTVGSGHTFTVTAASKFPSIYIASFSGTDTTANVDQNSSFSGNAGTMQAGSITPSVANEVVVAGVCTGNATIATIDSGYSTTDALAFAGGVSWGGGMAYKVQTTAVATNPTWSNSALVTGAVIASFKSGAGGGGGGASTPQRALAGVGR